MSIEHRSKDQSYDGVCFNYLCVVKSKNYNASIEWVSLNENISNGLKALIENKGFILMR